MATKTETAGRIEVVAAIEMMKAVADAIREVGEIPSGHLYAMLMAHGCSLEAYNKIIDSLKNAGIVTESNYLLKWNL